MRAVHKLRPVVELEATRGRDVKGHVVKLGSGRTAEFRDESGRAFEVAIPGHIKRRWLAAAVAVAPVPALAIYSEAMDAEVLWCVFPLPEHEALDEHVKLDAKTIELAASESIQIRTGRSTITVNAAGEIRIRGRNIHSRASNLQRIRGGGVRIN